jgi:hypothetical protein
MNKTKILTWSVILLVVLNMSTIGTIVWRNSEEVRDQDSLVVVSEGSRFTGRHFRNTLDFDEEQMKVFREANRRFQPRSHTIIYRIDSLKNKMFDELQHVKPDSLILDSLSLQIGAQHTALKRETIRFYQQIKAVCSPEQQARLGTVFKPLFRNESIGNRRGGGKGATNGQGKGHVNGRNFNNKDSVND